MGALTTPPAAVFDIAHLFRGATRQQLGHQVLVVERLVARMGVGKRVPVIGKDLLEDTPVPRGLYQHRLAPSWGHQLVAVKRLYHTSAASSTPARPGPGNLSPASVILALWGLLDRKNEKSYAIKDIIPRPSLFPFTAVFVLHADDFALALKVETHRPIINPVRPVLG